MHPQQLPPPEAIDAAIHQLDNYIRINNKKISSLTGILTWLQRDNHTQAFMDLQLPMSLIGYLECLVEDLQDLNRQHKANREMYGQLLQQARSNIVIPTLGPPRKQ